ncbi:unnamed protein product [Nesidiocoris tenuis]|uniref:Uncharacterized protein n=2 Tax=Nesidiocoris tenuis TaxID=355587 RepID=A0A6H5GXE5_9HEMI|nr:Hypothetical protein NTJ_06806 [Nesidiocoris tenuis]CAB0009316.1 unnamed protein product [Nesidiocoris tenuis]
MKSTGLQPCNKSRCKTCAMVYQGTEYSSPNTEIIYRVNGTANCQTSFVVYKLRCRFCNAFYVGKTSCPLNKRVNVYRSRTKAGANESVSQHAIKHGKDFDECFFVRVLQRLREGQATKLHLEEKEQIKKLVAFKPPGLNTYR